MALALVSHSTPLSILGSRVVVASARSENSREQSRRLQQFPHAPDVIGDASLHRWRDAQRPVNPAEVVPREKSSGKVAANLCFHEKSLLVAVRE